MSTARSRYTLPALTLLTALLVTPAAVHARPSQAHREVRPAAAASASFLGSVWPRLTGLWGASGGSIDPNGGKAPTSGPSIDPNGGGTISPGRDSGVTIDPNG